MPGSASARRASWPGFVEHDPRSWRRFHYYAAVLEGPSSAMSSVARPKDAAQRHDTGAPVRPSEPRPEIWFHRRVNLFSAVKDLWQFRELTITLAERDLRIRYKQAV